MEANIRPRLSHSNSFGNDAEKDTAGCRALIRKYIVIGGHPRKGLVKTMSIENMFGDLDKIDILAETKTGEVVMVLVCNGFIDGSPETQKALLDKMEGYLNHTQSEEFQKEYGGWPVILRVTLGREPDEHILALLSKCPAWAADYGVKLEIEIGGKQVRIVES